MGNKIFINYRRSINSSEGQLLYNALARKFDTTLDKILGTSRVFLDTNGIDGGETWLKVLAKQVDNSAILIALIGEGWLDAQDEHGNRRLDKQNDFVRYEIARALNHDIPVLPVLINNATMPSTDELPPDMQLLPFKQYVQIRVDHFNRDVQDVIKRIKPLIRRASGVPIWQAALASGALAAGAAVASHTLWPNRVVVDEVALAKLEEQLNEKDTEISGLRRREQAARSRIKRVSSEREQLEALIRQKDAALKQLSQQAGQSDQALKKKLQKAEQEIASLKKQLKETEGRLSHLQSENEHLQQEIVKLNKKRDKYTHGYEFDDCNGADWCPKMIVVRGGWFKRGSLKSEKGRGEDEGPRWDVKIKTFAVGRFEVTFAEWDACVKDGGCGGYKPKDEGWGRGNRPVINVSWNDAQAYVKWLSRKTGKTYRLLTEAEWEYVARAGTSTAFWWGNSISTDQANYDGNYTYSRGSKGVYRNKTVPVNSFKPNPFGLYNVHGNVWEWVQDHYHSSYKGSPTDGSAWEKKGDRSTSRVLRGGSWFISPQYLRSAIRNGYFPTLRNYNIGFRLSRTLTP